MSNLISPLSRCALFPFPTPHSPLPRRSRGAPEQGGVRNYFKTSGYLTTVPLLPIPHSPQP
ncbi:CobN component of cobalt chelatase involved in B12 biosynthesis [Nodularia spumigena CCY9414]|nr:CobN component of cobalt chelatase involved in B12 biosynthesis [Nodularia spumigena CCY9414]